MTAILARRIGIICLASTLFALGLLHVVENHGRRHPGSGFSLSAPCPQPSGASCVSRS